MPVHMIRSPSLCAVLLALWERAALSPPHLESPVTLCFVTPVRLQDKLDNGANHGSTSQWARASSDFQGGRSQDDHRSHLDASQVSDVGSPLANAASYRAYKADMDAMQYGRNCWLWQPRTLLLRVCADPYPLILTPGRRSLAMGSPAYACSACLSVHVLQALMLCLRFVFTIYAC